ncbi:hypothetical protein NVP1029O_01, partial [Vibrio phage 1.029.O._10N.261.55.A7]
MEIISRKQAKELGLSYYFTGKKCKNGHVSKRDISGSCYQCKLEWERSNPRKSNSRKEYMKEYLSSYEIKNKSEIQSRYYQNNKESILEKSKAKRESNKAYYNQKLAERRSRKKQATPIWFDAKSASVLYEKAREFGLEVDHVVPLTSNLVCGLHCTDNLQLLSREENMKKLNKVWPDMPGDL